MIIFLVFVYGIYIVRDIENEKRNLECIFNMLIQRIIFMCIDNFCHHVIYFSHFKTNTERREDREYMIYLYIESLSSLIIRLGVK